MVGPMHSANATTYEELYNVTHWDVILQDMVVGPLPVSLMDVL